MKKFAVMALGLLFFCVGCAVAFFGLRNVLRASDSNEWPTVPGVVQVSAVDSRRSSGSSSTTTYHAEIVYEYQVDEQTFSGDDVAFGDYGSSDRSHAAEIVGQYPVGAAVTVSYLPEDPTVAVLEPGLKGQAWFMPGLGIAFALIGGVVGIVGLLKR